MTTHASMLVSLGIAILAIFFGVLQLRSSRRLYGIACVVMMSVLFFVQTYTLISMGVEKGSCPIRGAGEFVFFLGWILWILDLIVFNKTTFLRISVLVFIALCCAVACLLGMSTSSSCQPDVLLSWHVILMIVAYALFSIAAVTAIVYLRQAYLMKLARLSGQSKLMPALPDMSHLMLKCTGTGVGVMLLSFFIGFLMHRGIPMYKWGLGGALCVAYLCLLLAVLWRGMPGRLFSCCILVLFLYSLVVLVALI